jgi:mannose-6-phosphate isomerase-like protein (cupin superfamily)
MRQEHLHSNLEKQFEAVVDYWSPRIVAEANRQYVKVVKAKGEFVWHAHADEDEFFLVCKGTLIIRYRDRADVTLQAGDFHVVPRGVQHMTAAAEECWIVLVEPAATRHTGDIVSAVTKSIDAQRPQAATGST